MFGDTARRSGGTGELGRRAGRTIRAAGLAALAVAGLWAATASGSPPPSAGATVFVHSATSGELGGGRLTLHGVSRRVTWAHHSGRSGVMAVRRMHRRLFSGRKRAATGTLHVAGHHGGDELTVELSKPHYNATRHTVSYRIKRLGNGHLPSLGARAAGARQRRTFGAASLAIVGASQTASLGAGDTYYECDPYGTGTELGCWGTVAGSGLKPNQTLTGTVNYSDGSSDSFDRLGIVVTTDQYGELATYELDLLCNPSLTSFDVSGVAADGSTVSAHAGGPYYYNNGNFVCSNVGP